MCSWKFISNRVACTRRSYVIVEALFRLIEIKLDWNLMEAGKGVKVRLDAVNVQLTSTFCWFSVARCLSSCIKRTRSEILSCIIFLFLCSDIVITVPTLLAVHRH